METNKVGEVLSSAARANVNRDGSKVVVAVEGDWSIRQAPTQQVDEALRNLEQQQAAGTLEFEASRMGSWDTSFLVFVSKVDAWCRQRGVRLVRESLPAGMASLLSLANEVAEKKTGRVGEARTPLLARLGNWALGVGKGFYSSLSFIGEILLSFGRILRGRASFNWRLFWLTMQECSAQALPIVSLISFLTGLILAFVGAIQLRQFGAGIYVANLVAVAMAQEMGAIMTGIIMAGRTGAAFAAQIGSMKVSEEIDALTTLAISPIDFLVNPRVLALCLMMPLLTLYSDVVGMLGGGLVGVGFLNLSVSQYWNQTLGAMGLTDIIIGVVKSAIFGVLVAMAGCQRGIQCGNDAAAVGNAATSAVVLSITWIVASDAVLDVLQQILKI
jgi:phospholipid/cholesterol/gamma-HCH transport system permease protein